MIAAPEPITPEKLADMILRAAGGGLRHHDRQRAAIIKAAEAAINAIKVAG